MKVWNAESLSFPMELGTSPSIRAAGYHQATISAVERTERTPGIDVLLGICRALAVTPDQLFRRAGALPVEGEGPDEGFWELWGVYKRLTAGERTAVIDFALFQEGRRG